MTSADSACPGCGLGMPPRPEPAERRWKASAACLALLDEVIARELQHAAHLGSWHQMTVDAYGAQHVDPAGPRIGPAFALIGLYLALERGLNGPQVRDAHAFLARTRREWPAFEPPARRWRVTVFDVAMVDVEEHAAAVGRWGASVWEAWGPDQRRIRELTDTLHAGWSPVSRR